MSDLERRFSFDSKTENILGRGAFSQVIKIYDDNGELYAGKLPVCMYLGSFLSENKSDYLDRVATSRYHENWIAQKIYEIKPDWIPKPEGVFAVRYEKYGEEFYFPAFVNEYDESLEAVVLDLEGNPLLEQLWKKGFLFHSDVITKPNNLISQIGQIKLIDFGHWSYEGVINPYPCLNVWEEDYEFYFKCLRKDTNNLFI